MSADDPILGHFHGDGTQVCRLCCTGAGPCAHPDGQWPYYANDVREGHVGPNCDQCGQPVLPQEVTS